MAGKASAFASRELFRTLEDGLTKNQLIDFAVHIARDALDRPHVTPTDPEILRWLQPHIDAVRRARGDPKTDLLNRHAIHSPNKPSAKK